MGYVRLQRIAEKQPKYIAVGLAILVVAATLSRGGESAERPWFVRTVVYSEVTLCESAAVSLHLEPWSIEPLRISLKSDEFTDADWAVLPLEPGTYSLHVQVVSCNGWPGQIATLDFDYRENNRRKEIYVGLRFDRGILNLDYVEIGTEWDGARFFSVTKNGNDVILTNVSDVELRRCEFYSPHFDEEFLVEGEWDTVRSGDWREWPEEIGSLKPGESVVLKPNGIAVYRPANPRLVQASAKRFIIKAQPQRLHFLVLAEPKWAPAGLPGCDRYYLEGPTTEADPPVRIWDSHEVDGGGLKPS